MSTVTIYTFIYLCDFVRCWYRNKQVIIKVLYLKTPLFHLFIYLFSRNRGSVALVIRAPIATNPLSSQKVMLQENCRKSALGMRLEAKALAQRALYSWRGCQYRTSEMTKATPKKVTLEYKYFAQLWLFCDITSRWYWWEKNPVFGVLGKERAKIAQDNARVPSRVLSRKFSRLIISWADSVLICSGAGVFVAVSSSKFCEHEVFFHDIHNISI